MSSPFDADQLAWQGTDFQQFDFSGIDFSGFDSWPTFDDVEYPSLVGANDTVGETTFGDFADINSGALLGDSEFVPIDPAFLSTDYLIDPTLLSTDFLQEGSTLVNSENTSLTLSPITALLQPDRPTDPFTLEASAFKTECNGNETVIDLTESPKVAPGGLPQLTEQIEPNCTWPSLGPIKLEVPQAQTTAMDPFSDTGFMLQPPQGVGRMLPPAHGLQARIYPNNNSRRHLAAQSPGLLPPVDFFEQNSSVRSGARTTVRSRRRSSKTGRKTASKKHDLGQLYEPLPGVPASQGPIEGPHGENYIEYDTKGEFYPHERRFRRSEFAQYLFHTRKHAGMPGVRQPTLWIQNHPAMCNERYPRGSASFKCRMASCPVQNQTILKGMWQVAVDEFSDWTGTVYDPFHMAGHFHLYCLERAYDFYQLHLEADVRPDCRHFEKEDRNQMSLRHNDGGVYMQVYKEWAKDHEVAYEEHCRQYPDPAQRPRRVIRDEDHLWHRLTQRKIQVESSARRKCREERAKGSVQSTDIQAYGGDLKLYAKLVARRMRRKKNPGRVSDSEPEAGHSSEASSSSSSYSPSRPPSVQLQENPVRGRGTKRRFEGTSTHHCPPIQAANNTNVYTQLAELQAQYTALQQNHLLMMGLQPSIPQPIVGAYPPQPTALHSAQQMPQMAQAQAPVANSVYFNPELHTTANKRRKTIYIDEAQLSVPNFEEHGYNAGFAPPAAMILPDDSMPDMMDISKFDISQFIDVEAAALPDAPVIEHQVPPTPSMALLTLPFPTDEEEQGSPKSRRSPRLSEVEGRSRRSSRCSLFSGSSGSSPRVQKRKSSRASSLSTASKSSPKLDALEAVLKEVGDRE